MSYFPSALEIVFVRYGIFAPEFDYNDYHNIDVSGKVVLILEGEPNGFYNNQVPTRHSLIETKQRTALSRGAIAVIIIPDIALHSVHTWEYLESQYNSPEYNLAFSPSSILTIIINPQLVGLIFDQQLSSEKQFDYISHQNSVLLSSKFIFKGKYRDKSFQISNLLFKIEGHDSRLKDECVIISAHYDHLGIGPVVNHDSIYNGFMDNALGCAALLELSRLLFTDLKELKRTILLIFTAGEERGLLGSRYYTNNPILPLYKTIANINIDGVAFIDNFASVTGIGASFSSLKEILDKTAYENGLFVDTLQGFSDDLEAFNRSDQVAFAYAGIPSILVIDAVNYKNINKEYGFAKLEEYFSDIYHTPFDDTSQFINWDASSQHTDFLVKFVRNIINLNISPEWYPDNRFYLERLRTKAEKR